MNRRHCWLGCSVVALALVTGVAFWPQAFALRAEEPTREQAEFFDKKVKPILEANCFRCHSHEANRSKGELMLDSLGSLLKGGATGPAIVPGHPEKSLLIKAIGYKDEELRMPPSKRLSAEQVALLTEWIKMGAPWPGSATKTALRPRGKITDEDRRYWAFVPVKAPAVPDVQDAAWLKNPVDRFIAAKLEAESLKPSPPASKTALVRRLYFDLIGLPPSPEEVDAFVKDADPQAYEKLVDRLLASPRYGERWARHWLDLVRYAESDGFRLDSYRPDAWHYRDYVIRSFNNDKPYDQFLREQIAGDELMPGDAEALAAIGYLRLWIYEYNQRDVRTQWDGILNDITDVTGEAFLGLGMGCARCHDHKYDAILQKDYFRMRAFFANILPCEDAPLVSPKNLADYQQKRAVWEEKSAAIRAQIDAIEVPEKNKAEKEAIAKFPKDIQAMMLKPEKERKPLEKQLAALAYRQVQYEFDTLDKRFKDARKDKLAALRKELAKFDEFKPKPLPQGMTVVDSGLEAPPTLIPKKGKEAIAPGFLSVFDESPATITPPPGLASSGRRAALATWLTRADNPLTTRVIVNRIWQYHFGRGLVGTSNDFGRLGETPSHPELLDWLTTRFVQDGWSIKKMHRLLVTSRAYRQSALQPPPAAALQKDPDNRWLWKMYTRRLDAEQIRDAILAVTGKLDLTAGGPSIDAGIPRRTIYAKVFRNSRHPLLDVFDGPEGVFSTGKRNVTTTPLQALLLINSPYMLGQAKAFADRLHKEQGKASPSPLGGEGGVRGDEAMIGQAFRLAFGRSPTPDEVSASRAFLEQQVGRIKGKEARREAWADFCHVLLNANEFLYVD